MKIVQAVTDRMQTLGLHYNHKRWKGGKALCTMCSRSFRRDYMRAHCKRCLAKQQRTKYDHKAHCNGKTACPKCNARITRKNMCRHQRSAACTTFKSNPPLVTPKGAHAQRSESVLPREGNSLRVR